MFKGSFMADKQTKMSPQRKIKHHPTTSMHSTLPATHGRGSMKKETFDLLLDSAITVVFIIMMHSISLEESLPSFIASF